MCTTDVGRCPATLFIQYWRLAASWTATQRAAASEPSPIFESRCREALKADDAATAHDEVAALVGPVAVTPDLASRRRVLTAMAAIDRAFHDVHPRALAIVKPDGGVTTAPEWLNDLRERRAEGGFYVCADDGLLIPRGPLLRSPRDEAASSGDLLNDRFAALSLVPAGLEHDGRVIGVHLPVIQIEASFGVLASLDPGSESVGFAPVATEPGQIEVKPRHQAGALFADYRVATAFDAGSAAMQAIVGLGSVDVVVMPELALGEAHVDHLSSALRDHAGGRARIIVSGSNLTTELQDGLPYNETRVLNGRGEPLWRQRKLWTAGIGRDRAAALGLDVPDGQRNVLEATACGDTLVVADVDGFGRCVVLICQDVTMPTLVPEVISRFQPDWVFVPILDQSVDEGRWAHSRAYGLSELSQARFVAVTSFALAPSYDPAHPCGMGFALGPKEPTESSDQRRAFHLVSRPPPDGRMWDAVTWRRRAWGETNLSVDYRERPQGRSS